MKAIQIAAAAFLVTAAAIKAAPAFAEPVIPDVNVALVHTADLDLSTDAGRRALDQRLIIAAREVCGEASNVDLEGKNAVRECRAETIAAAASQREQLLASAKYGTPILVASAR